MDEKVWGTTSGDGSFDFPIAPGEHTFDVYEGDKKERSFTATVTAGETSDAGTIKFKAEDDDDERSMTVIMLSAGVVMVALAVAMLMRRRRLAAEKD
jgi:hypothetical protein